VPYEDKWHGPLSEEGGICLRLGKKTGKKGGGKTVDREKSLPTLGVRGKIVEGSVHSLRCETALKAKRLTQGK